MESESSGAGPPEAAATPEVAAAAAPGVSGRPGARAWAALPYLAAIALTLLLLAEALMPGRVLFYRDLGTQFLPLLADARQGVDGAVDLLPFWTHATSNGRPLLANPSLALLSPFSLIWLALPHEAAFDAFLVLHALLAATGMAALARGMGMSRAAATCAAVSFGLGGGTVSALNLWWAAVALGWAPWVILAGWKACESATPRRLALLAMALALQANGGMPEIVLATLACGGAASLASGPGPLLRRAGRAALIWGACGIWAIALAAPQLVPSVLHARTTLRAHGFLPDGILANSLHPAALPGLVIPRWGGHPLHRLMPGEFPGAEWTHTGTPYLISHHCGLIAAALALVALLAIVARGAMRLPDRRRLLVATLAAVSVASVVVALGEHVPPLRWLALEFAPLPLRYPVKALYGTFLALPLLAGLGLDALSRRLAGGRDGSGGAGSADGAGDAGISEGDAGATRFVVTSPIAKLLAAALALAAGLELLAAHRGFVPATDAADLAPAPLAEHLHARAEALGARPGQWHLHHERLPKGEWGPPRGSIAPTEQAMQLWQRRMIMPPMGAAMGLSHALDRVTDLLIDMRTLELSRIIYRSEPSPRARLLGEAGVLFVISPHDDLSDASGHVLLRERAIGPADGVPEGSGWLYRNVAFRPRYELLGIPRGDGAVEGISEDHRGMTLRVRTLREATLLMRVAVGDLGTWSASTSDGRPLLLRHASGCFAATVIPAGNWTIRVEHVPPGWHASVALSALAACGVLLALGPWRANSH